MKQILESDFGSTTKGEPCSLFTLQNDSGMTVKITNYGGAIQSLLVPDRKNCLVDTVLGYDSILEYEKGDKYLGALIGRCANRIANGTFSLNNREYLLAKNDGCNHLHGGIFGYDKQVWKAKISGDSLYLSYTSPDGEEGYPGKLEVTVIYTLTENQALKIEYQASSDQDTLCNLTNHSYFNLSGQESGSILDQKIQIFSDYYTSSDEQLLPDGQIVSVYSTPLNLTEPTMIGDQIDNSFEPLQRAGGFDHNFVIRGEFGKLRKMAYAESPATGITLTGYTTLPGMQFYSGNFLDQTVVGKNDAVYDKRSGFCLESQFYPDAPHHKNFPSPVLHANEKYQHSTVFQFGILKD